MAFIFVPNADGSFTEGDKQTNPDTGVEYIYNDGAWRALGPKIENEFDTLDDRYVRLNATSIVGDLYRLRGPNAAGTGLSSFQNISDGEHRLYNIALAEDSNTGWAASVQYVQNYVGTQIDAIPDVNLDEYATEDYVDQSVAEYLPLTGGTLTGRLTIEQPRTDSNTNCFVIKGRIKDDSNNLTESILLKSYKRQNSSSSSDYLAYYGESGGANEILNRKTAQEEFAAKSDLDNITLDNYLPLSGGTLTGTLTGQLIKSIRTGGGYALEVKPDDATTKAFIRTDGTSRLSTLTVESPMSSASQRAFEIKGRMPNNTVSKDFFYMYTNNDGTPSAMNYNGKMDSTNNLATVGYVNSKSTGVTGGSFYVSSGSLYFEMD